MVPYENQFKSMPKPIFNESSTMFNVETEEKIESQKLSKELNPMLMSIN